MLRLQRTEFGSLARNSNLEPFEDSMDLLKDETGGTVSRITFSVVKASELSHPVLFPQGEDGSSFRSKDQNRFLVLDCSCDYS
jgi:hypothetical protein